MKNIIRSLLLLMLPFGISALCGGQPPRGVAGVDVVVKQNPNKRAVTDARGNFAFDGLAPGSYTLSFRARKAANTKTTTTDKVTVGTSYSIKIDGAKRSVTKSSLTGDSLLAGVDLKIDVGSGAKVRGQVAAGALKKMVWVPREPGSHIPGYWAEAGTAAASRSNTQVMGQDELRDAMNRASPNMTDPGGQFDPARRGPNNPDANPGR